MGTKGVKVAVLCDPDQKVLDERAEKFASKYGYKPETETDLRKVFDRKDVDVVGVATPNHWHALATIWACQAGKDVYVEKPGSHNIYEGRKMVEAAKKYGRIVQHGVQLRSSEAVREAVDHLRERADRQRLHGPRPGLPRPALDRPRQGPGHRRRRTLELERLARPRRRSGRSRSGSSTTTGTGTGTTATATSATRGSTRPTCASGAWAWRRSRAQIVAMGGKFLWDDDKETPEVLSSSYLFPEQKKMIEFEVRPWATNTEAGAGVGNIFYGSDGYLVIKGYNTYESFTRPQGQARPEEQGRRPGRQALRQLHRRASASRDPKILHGPVETAHYSSGLAHLGNIAYRLGRQLKFDPATETFVGDSEADAMLTREYRKPFVVPEQV